MTKKAKTKTKSDETPPKSVPSVKQSTEPGAGPAANQQAEAAAPPQLPTSAGPEPASQPPTSAGPGPASQPPTSTGPGPVSQLPTSAGPGPASQPPTSAGPGPTSQPPTSEGSGPTSQLPATVQLQVSPATAAAAPAPLPSDTSSGDSKVSQPPVAVGQVPAELGVMGSPPEKSPTAQAPAQLGVTDSPQQKPPVAFASPQLGAVGTSPEKSAATQAPAQVGSMGSPQEMSPVSLASPQLGAVGSPPEKSPTAQAPAQLVVGPPTQKTPAAQAPTQLGVIGSPVEKSPAPKQDNTSNTEPKLSGPVQSEPLKEQPTAPQPPLADLSLNPASSDKTKEVPIDKPQKEKDTKPTASPKVQDSRKDLPDKNQKVTPSTPKTAPNGQSSKQAVEKQNKRQVAKENVPSNSVQKGEHNVNKPSGIDNKQNSQDKVLEKTESSTEPKTAKDNAVAKVGDVKDEPNKKQLTGATSGTLTNQNIANEASKQVTDAEPPKPKDPNKNIAAAMTENIKSADKSETPKDQAVDKKTVEQKVQPDVATQGNQQKAPSPKTAPSEKVNKNAPPKKNKQKNETGGSKTEGVPNTKEVKTAEKDRKKDTATAAIGSQPSPEVNEAPNKSTATESPKISSLDVLPDTVSKLPTDHSPQVKEEANNQQTKITKDSKGGKEGPVKDEAQSKSSSKKKNRQKNKSVSEDVKPSDGSQEVSKNNEKKKPTPASPSKEKESNRATASAPAEKNRKNAPGETVTSGPKVSPGKSPIAETSPVSVTTNNLTAEKDSSDKIITGESQLEEQGASKKKKRNRHKKKNKAGDGDNSTDANVEGGKQHDTNATAVGGERKVKEKQQTITPPTNKSKGQQKDSQTGQTNTSKGTQPGATTAEDGQASSETPAKQGSESTAQTASAKKRNRRKKKGVSGIEKDSDATLPQECKSAEAKETPVAKAEEQKAKVNIAPTQAKTDETHKKKSDSKPAPKLEKTQQQDGQLTEGSEDHSENFVEVKSKNKRNKKKKLDSAETRDEFTSSNNVPKIVPENAVDPGVSSSKGKTETENASGASVKEATNKVSGPKISQEAREQKMLNKKLAERAQLKIQKQIESNALSEVEKSEKYLETITKNLRELTKLRSSRLEDVLQKPGDEEFDYEYTPVQRNTFLATTCHICKESKQRETMKICEQCHLMSYCSEEHQKSDWPAHKDLCQAISEMCKERGTDNLYAPAVGLSAEEYRGYRMNALLECSAILNRQLEPYEQEILLYPNVCQTCHLPSATNLHTCESCSMVSYCSPEHRPSNHDVWCHDLQLYKSLIIYQSRNGIISPQLPVFLSESFQPLSGDMQSDLRTLSGGIDASPLERAVLSEIATGPLTALFALQKSNKVSGTTEKLVIHLVGAEWSFELERADKWEAFLLHLIPSLKTLVLVFVGPEVCSLPPEARGLLQKQSKPCPQCQEKARTVEMVIPSQPFYHEYVASQDFIPPTIICAYNAGLYRPNGHKDVDSWSETVAALLRDPGVPVAVTSYTAEEVLKDAERLQHHRPLNFVLPPSQNPYRSLRPNRNFASDDVTPVIFKNYYIMIATSLTQ